jgi:hypothetical protein
VFRGGRGASTPVSLPLHPALHTNMIFLKNAVFWGVSPCKSSVNGRFGGMYRLHLQGINENRTRNLLVCSIVPQPTMLWHAPRQEDIKL